MSRPSVFSPFPLTLLPRVYQWHTYSTSILSGQWCGKSQFISYMTDELACGRSWGIAVDGEVLGIAVFHPIWRGGQLCDGEFHIALARRVWGQGVFEQVAEFIGSELFSTIPTLQRISASIPSTYSPSISVAENIGFAREGVLRNAVTISGQLRDVIMFGILRSEFYEFWRTKNNYNKQSDQQHQHERDDCKSGDYRRGNKPAGPITNRHTEQQPQLHNP